MVSRSLSRIAAFGIACVIGTAYAASPGVCDLGRKRGGLTLYAVEGTPIGGGESQILADVDGDGIADKIVVLNNGSGSIIPADLDVVTVTLSATDQTLTLEEQRLHVVKYQSTYFVVTGRAETDKGPFHTDIYRIGPKAITRICSFTPPRFGE